MTKGHGRGIWVVTLLLMCSSMPLASASGGGLLLSGDSFNIIGDQEVGSGDVNISIDIVAHGVNSVGFVEMTFTAEDNTPLALDNRSISLSAGQSSSETFDISDVPIGTHTLSFQLWGDVGTNFENNVSQFQVFVQRLSPGNASLDTPGGWSIVSFDPSQGEPSGNASLRDGDHAWVVATVSNSGDVEWQGNATIFLGNTLFSTQVVNVVGLTTSFVNFTIGPLFEGTSQISIELSYNQSVVDVETMGVDIGPPPLARPILSMAPETYTPDLSETINWTISVENLGESNFSGSISCDYPIGVQIYSSNLLIPTNGNLTWNVSIDVRPGVIECQIANSTRIHFDSLITSAHVYDMPAGHLMRAGGDGLTVTGGPFHVGDAAPLAILIHNGGDFSGTGSLEVREGSSDGNDMGDWSLLESRVLEVGSSLELGSQYITSVSGERMIEWRVVSQDSLVANDLSGSLILTIQPSQSLDSNISSYGWTLQDGLSIEVTTLLSAGEGRLVLFELGTTTTSGDATQISTEIFLSPGQRTLNYNLGHPTSSSDVWVELTPISWVSSTVAQDQITLVYPNPVVSVIIDSISPESPAPGDDVTISYSLLNEGNADTLAGTIMLIDMKRDGEVLWPVPGSSSDIDPVESGETVSGEIEIRWPKGSVVDFSLIWQTPHTDVTGSASFLSQVDDTVETDATIDWMSIVYGSLAGLFIGLVTRTVMRARAGEPLLSRRERGERKEKPKKSPEKVVAEKVEVACPACDQRLRVPATYSGSARCPACAQTFPVVATHEPPSDPSDAEETESEEEYESDDEVVEVMSDPEPEEEKSSASSDDVIKCPDCEQKLKVPYDRRPVRARCPACKCEFRALKR